MKRMERTFVRFLSFEKAWKAMGLGEDEYIRLEELLLRDPTAGTVIEGSGGVRKIRFAFPGRGKSGSARVIYVDFMVEAKVYFIYAYPKSAKENLSKAEIADFKKLVEQLKRREGGSP